MYQSLGNISLILWQSIRMTASEGNFSALDDVMVLLIEATRLVCYECVVNIAYQRTGIGYRIDISYLPGHRRGWLLIEYIHISTVPIRFSVCLRSFSSHADNSHRCDGSNRFLSMIKFDRGEQHSVNPCLVTSNASQINTMLLAKYKYDRHSFTQTKIRLYPRTKKSRFICIFFSHWTEFNRFKNNDLQNR